MRKQISWWEATLIGAALVALVVLFARLIGCPAGP